ncbi:unnamed protein product [Auanema sp. JU1783]|nr:unnamed protein product [Auanema sp. JU1783]
MSAAVPPIPKPRTIIPYYSSSSSPLPKSSVCSAPITVPNKTADASDDTDDDEDADDCEVVVKFRNIFMNGMGEDPGVDDNHVTALKACEIGNVMPSCPNNVADLNKSISSEKDNIQVQVEDITPDSGGLLSKPSVSMSDLEGGHGFLKKENSLQIGVECLSNEEQLRERRLAKEIADSFEERPPPPPNLYDVASMNSELYSRRTSDRKPTLLEKIIRSHSIWYLPNVGRPAVTYMLRNMEPGNFVVRSASRPSCMAISVKLPTGFDIEIDHYIIEVVPNRGVRIGNSPLLFTSLPMLIAHYCIDGEELQIKLRLPASIRNCESTKGLQSIALLGQDFWSSDMSLPRCSSRSSHRTNDSSSSHGGIGPSKDDEIHPSVHYAVSEAPRIQNKKRTSTGRKDPSRFATVHGDLLGAAKEKETSSPPNKQERSDLQAKVSRVSRRSQSVRAPSEKSSLANQQQQSSSILRRSFLRNIFGKDSNSKAKNNPVQLAHCDYFIPAADRQKTLKGSRSAYDVAEVTPGSRPLWDLDNIMMNLKSGCGPEDMVVGSKNTSALRRERSDLCPSSVARLVRHNDGSPGPSQRIQPLQQQRLPMRPPNTVLDTKTCVEELRRKRLQSTNEMLNPAFAAPKSMTASPQISMRKVNMSPSWRHDPQKQEHRLSVPNLVPEPSSSVLQSAKALKEKLGRTGNGELSNINEGLITPVVRRKHFNRLNQEELYASSTLSSSSSNDRNDRGESVDNHVESQVSIPNFNNKPNPLYDCTKSTSNENKKESELIWRRTGSKGIEAATNKQLHTAGNRGSCFLPSKSLGTNWSAVNSELKYRQRIAKVRQLPHQSADKMTVANESPIVDCTKPSEYAQLTELDNFRQDFLGGRDEDNVSVAGTVFNEPWDSNVWENLLDLAHHGDDSSDRRLTEPIMEEDSDSDVTAGSTQMAESDDDADSNWPYGDLDRRPLPSDKVTNKAWELSDSQSCRYGTLDSRTDASLCGTMRRPLKASSPPASMLSLPRPVSRYSHALQMGSLDDLPTSVPYMSPMMNDQAKQPSANSGLVIQHYVEKLAQDSTTIFGATLRRFIECTVESDEADPSVVFRNVRQFLTGIKNYLVKHGEGDLHQIIEEERNRLNANQILSIDAILEAVLHKLLLKRIKPHLYHVMVREHSRTGALEAVTTNIRAVRSIPLANLRFSNPKAIIVPSNNIMEQIKVCLRKMQNHYSPLKKYENLLRAVNLVMLSQDPSSDENSEGSRLPPADDLVRWFVYILARTSTVGCEVEAWYMWELLPQHMLTQGDASYYLTSLFSAVHILKSMDAVKKLAEKENSMMNSMDLSRLCHSPNDSNDAFLRVAIPDVNAGCIKYATFPGVPQMTTSKLCRVIAHQQGITNPEDFGLYLVLNGFETALHSSDTPDAIRDKMRNDGKNFLFAYKRHDAKIAWPSQVLSGLALC